jgi:murein DD-endopeptidase MepM/ murein hydrolase activator NlpD
MVGIIDPIWPLARQPKTWTAGGSFGASRDGGKRLHQGIDLYAPEGTPVVASEGGIVTASQGWSGPGTKAVLVYSPKSDITILYGAVAPGSFPPIGTQLKRGDLVGKVGVYPAGSTMLHLEIWPQKLKPPRAKWLPNTPPPSFDPAEYLERASAVWTPVPGLIPDPNPPQVSPKGAATAGVGILAAVAGLYLFLK